MKSLKESINLELVKYIDSAKHEIISAQIFMEDKKIKDWFTDDERKIIKEAIEDHRASSNHSQEANI